MYLEFFILISDYYKTITKRIALYEIALPFIVALGILVLLYFNVDSKTCKKFIDNSLTLLGILLGFSITIITILTTGNSKNLQKIREQETSYTISNRKITLFDLLLINFTYSVVVEIILIIGLLISPLLIKNIPMSIHLKYVGFSIMTGLVIHLLLLTMRNLTDFYLILIKK